MSLSGGVETKQKQYNKTSQYISHISPLNIGDSVAGVSPSQPAWANRDTHRTGSVAATRVGGEEPWLAQNTIRTNCGGLNIFIKHCVCAAARLWNVEKTQFKF